MNKFDKQLKDSRAASKANSFFMEFHDNNCFPYLAFTPSLAKENLPTEELFHARKANLVTADSMEKALFSNKRDGHLQFNANGDDDELSPAVSGRLGFLAAKKDMREIMIRDAAERIPEVIRELRHELAENSKL